MDPMARLFAQRLKEAPGWNIITDSRPGASGTIGTGIAAKSPPDGYTFVIVFDTHAVNPSFIASMPFDTKKDLDPVMIIGTSPMVISTHPDRPFRTVDELFAAVRTRPNSITYGTTGNGSLAHLTMKQLERQGKFSMVHVPYKGGGPLMTDAIGGVLDTFITTLSTQIPHIKAGRIRPLVVTGDTRTQQLPEVPSLAEKGFPGFSARAWWGILAPAQTPRPIIDSMNREMRRVLEEPAVRTQLEDQLAIKIWASTPEEMRIFVEAEMARWGEVVKENNLRAE